MSVYVAPTAAAPAAPQIYSPAAPAATQMHSPAAANPEVAAPPAHMTLIEKIKHLPKPALIGIAVIIVVVIVMMFSQKKKALAAAGKACKADGDCSSGACAHDPNKPSEQTCCIGTDKVGHWFKKYCGDQPTGGKCLNDKMCASGDCGVLDAARTRVKGCCANGTVRHLFRKYCAGQAAGADCRTNGMCASDKCHGNLFGLKLGKCK